MHRIPTLGGRFARLALALGLAASPAAAGGLSHVRAAFFDEDDVVFYEPANGDWFAGALATGDFDGDGADDLAAGVPNDDNLIGSYADSGIVIVRYGVADLGLEPGWTDAVLSQSTGASPDPPEVGDRFGYALAAGDFDGDGFDDLAVGIPYEDLDPSFDVGAVQIYRGSAAGLDVTGSGFFHEGVPGVPGDIHSGDWFGIALTACDFDGDGYDDLAIGVIGEDSDADQCGSVNVLRGSASGLGTTGAQRWHQDVPGMDGGNEAGDHWGAALACGDLDGNGFADLAVGVPGENSSAGGVHLLYGTAAGLAVANNELWTQGDPGVPETGETGDEMGDSVVVADFTGDGIDDVAVGVHGEDVALQGGGTAVNAGALLLFRGSPQGVTGAGSFAWTQSVTGLATSEEGDYWGHDLAAGDFDRDGRADVAISAPGETTSVAHAGQVTILRGAPDGLTAVGGQLWSQETPGVAGSDEAEDWFGRALAAGDFDATGHADLAIGAPQEDTGGFTDNGSVWALHGSLFADGFENNGTTGWSFAVP